MSMDCGALGGIEEKFSLDPFVASDGRGDGRDIIGLEAGIGGRGGEVGAAAGSTLTLRTTGR